MMGVRGRQEVSEGNEVLSCPPILFTQWIKLGNCNIISLSEGI